MATENLEKKYLSLEGLGEYDALIKQDITNAVKDKADKSHSHTDVHYTKSEIDSKISTINASITKVTDGTTTVKKAEHAQSADEADNANTATSATKDASGNVITSTYETKADASDKLAQAKNYTDTALSAKADKTHTHDDRYYTESEIDSKISAVNSSITKITDGSTTVKKAEHATAADEADKADIATKATQDGSGNVITSTYETKNDAADKLVQANNYTDTELAKKADKSHTHDDRYYTESEIDSKISAVNTTISKITSGTTTVKKAEHAATADQADLADLATKATQDASGNVITSTYETKSDAQTKFDNAKSYADSIVSGLATTASVDNKISAHNTSNVAHEDIRELLKELSDAVNHFLDVDDTTRDQLSEILVLIDSNSDLLDDLKDKVNVSDIVDNLTTSNSKKVLSAKQGVELKALIDGLYSVVDGKAAKTHTHAISDVTDLQVSLDNKSDKGHKHTVSEISDLTATAKELNYMDGVTSNVQTQLDNKADDGHKHTASDITGLTATVAELNYVDGVTSGIQAQLDSKAASSHSHAISEITNLQTTLNAKAAQTDLDTHTSDKVGHITSTERTNWGAAYTHSIGAHAPSNAEKNQNAFSNVKVGSTTIAADTTTDTITLSGTNITITPDTTNDSISFVVADGSTSAKGLVQLTDSITSTSKTTAATPNSVKSAYDLASSAKTTADGKADAGHGHTAASTSAAGFMTAAMVTKLDNTAEIAGLNTQSIGQHTTAISNLQTALNGITEISSAKINALFGK